MKSHFYLAEEVDLSVCNLCFNVDGGRLKVKARRSSADGIDPRALNTAKRPRADLAKCTSVPLLIEASCADMSDLTEHRASPRDDSENSLKNGRRFCA
jgi:hypothetical protein